MTKANYKVFLAVSKMRRQKIKDYHATGKTMAQVAEKFSISRGRAWQIVRDYK